MNILFSSAGRRIERIACFREALAELHLSGSLFATDCSPRAPALYVVNKAWLFPLCTEPNFIPSLLELARREDVRLVIPNVYFELPALSSNRERFAEEGIDIVVSSAQAVQLSYDKGATHSWLVSHKFPTVEQTTPTELLRSQSGWRFPVVLKPRCGSGSLGFRIVQSIEELKTIECSQLDMIVQECASGVEHTVNVYVNRAGRCICTIPHARLEVRAGEVSKAVTVKHPRMMALAKAIAEALPGAYGPLTIQCFLRDDGDIRVIEINPRFGGGYPLTDRAGGRFARWLIEEALGTPVTRDVNDWREGLMMLRYSEAVYLPADTQVATYYCSADT